LFYHSTAVSDVRHFDLLPGPREFRLTARNGLIKMEMQAIPGLEAAFIKLKEIAQKANVSISTVSRIINNQGNFSDDTRRKVLEIAGEYSKPGVAPHKLPGVSYGIAVFVPEANDFFDNDPSSPADLNDLKEQFEAYGHRIHMATHSAHRKGRTGFRPPSLVVRLRLPISGRTPANKVCFSPASRSAAPWPPSPTAPADGWPSPAARSGGLRSGPLRSSASRTP